MEGTRQTLDDNLIRSNSYTNAQAARLPELQRNDAHHKKIIDLLQAVRT